MKKITFALVTLLLSTSCTAQKTELNSEPWLLELSTSDIGTVRTVMYFDFEDSTYTAYTRKNADRTILGFWTSSLGRIFTKDFKNGSLLHIVKGKHHIQNDSTVLSGIFTSAMGNYYFNGTIINNELKARLTNKSKELRGTIKGHSNVPELPLDNYKTIYKEAFSLTSKRIFDRTILESKEWNKFDRKMQSVSSEVQDDLEIVFAFFYYGGKLPFSHFALMKIPESDTTDINTNYTPLHMGIHEIISIPLCKLLTNL